MTSESPLIKFTLTSSDRERLLGEMDIPSEKRSVFLEQIEDAIHSFRELYAYPFKTANVKRRLRKVADNADKMLRVMQDANNPDPDTQIMAWLLTQEASLRACGHFVLDMEKYFAEMQMQLRDLLVEYRDIAKEAQKDQSLIATGRPFGGASRLFAMLVLSAYVNATGIMPKKTRGSEPYKLLELCFDLSGQESVDIYPYYRQAIDYLNKV